MSRSAAFACVLCERLIAARAWHVILTPLSARCVPVVSQEAREVAAGVIVCTKCRDLPDAHGRLFPLCTAPSYCDLFDHSHTLAADRTGAATWLTQHGRLTSTPTPDTADEGTRP